MNIVRNNDKPVSLYLNLTNGCNSACVFCVSGSQNVTQRRDIPYDDILEIYHQLGIREGDEVILNGGEPTTYPDLLQLIEKTSARMARVYLCTNGRLLSRPDYAHKLLSAGVSRLSIPIHGRDASTHDGLTGRKGSLSQTLKGIHNAYAYRASRGHATTIELKLLTLHSVLPEWPSIVDFIMEEFGEPDVLVLSGLNMWSEAIDTYEKVTPNALDMQNYLNQTMDRIVYHDIKVVLWSIPLCLLSASHRRRFASFTCQTSSGNTDNIQVIYCDPDYPNGIELPSNEFDPGRVNNPGCQTCELLSICGPGSMFMEQIRVSIN